MKKTKPAELTGTEWAILKAVWDRQPCTAPDVTEALDESKGWAYSTVHTLMDRMVEKGLLVSEKLRRMDIYRPAITRRQAQKRELLYALKHAFDNALTPMMQCLLETRELSAEELSELEAVLKQKRKQAGAKE
ncbi:MAG: BlaI/MecI/CopY family transcriptional regulator [Verrucomicrobiota bacterium]